MAHSAVAILFLCALSGALALRAHSPEQYGTVKIAAVGDGHVTFSLSPFFVRLFQTADALVLSNQSASNQNLFLDVLNYKPDVVIMNFGFKDAKTYLRAAAQVFHDQYKAFVERLLQLQPPPLLVFVTPPPAWLTLFHSQPDLLKLVIVPTTRLLSTGYDTAVLVDLFEDMADPTHTAEWFERNWLTQAGADHITKLMHGELDLLLESIVDSKPLALPKRPHVNAETLRLAYVGDRQNPFPDLEPYAVRAFGSIHSLSNDGNLFVNMPEFRDSREFLPDIVIFQFGEVDAKSWAGHDPIKFKQRYVELIKEYTSLPSEPLVIVMTPTPVWNNHSFGTDSSYLMGQLLPAIREVAHNFDAEFFAVDELLKDDEEMFFQGHWPKAAAFAKIKVAFLQQFGSIMQHLIIKLDAQVHKFD